MPKLWDETIEAHRREVTEAVLETTASLVQEYGLRAVTMSQIAAETGIGRATLYKYFPDVETILRAWHERLIASHSAELKALVSGPGDASERLEAVLATYADIQYTQQTTPFAAALHHEGHVAHAEEHLLRLIADLLKEAKRGGALRSDVPVSELARYCLQALSAAAALPSRAAVLRLVAVTLDGLRAQP